MGPIRENVSLREEKLFKILKPISNLKRTGRLTVKEILSLSNIDYSNATFDIKEIENKKVSQICRGGSRFSKNCICVQFPEDSNEVIKWASRNGALFSITRERIDNVPCIVVDNPLKFYVDVCSYFFNKKNVKATAVLGSIGKTTTKRMINAVYSNRYKTFSDPENENQLDCVGYICQHIPKNTQLLVQEVSEDTPGMIDLISKIIKPNVAVFTAIDQSHIENYKTKDKIYQEVNTICNSMDKNSVAIVDYEDYQLREILSCKNIITISINSEQADFYSKEIEITPNGLKFDVVNNLNKKTSTVLLNKIYSKHNILAALSSFAAGYINKIDEKDIVKGINNYRTQGIRQNIFKTKDNITIYADCYNAVPKSVKSALVGAENIPINGKRITVIGDIEETGQYTKEVHDEIVKSVLESKTDVFIAYGDKISASVKRVEYDTTKKILCFDNKKQLNDSLKKIVKPDDLVLFKASRKSKLEETIKFLFKHVYYKEMFQHYGSIIKWRLKVILN